MRRAVLIALSLALLPAAALAQSQPDAATIPPAGAPAIPDVPNAQMLDQAGQTYKSMTPDQQQAALAQARQQYAAMTPEQRAALEQQAAKQWQSMTPEQQEKLKTEFSGVLSGGGQGDSQ